MTGPTARQDRVKYLFIWPAFLVVLVISLFPLIYALTASFLDLPARAPDPAAFRRARQLHRHRDLRRASGRSIGTTALITFISVFLQYVLGFALALALHHNVPAIVALTGCRSCCRCSLRPWAWR